MSRYLLDTNVISNVTKPTPSEALMLWMAAQADDDLFISALSLAEISRGILDKPPGRKRQELEHWFWGSAGPRTIFSGRVLPFDENAAFIWARLMTEGRQRGKPRSHLDMIIAATAEANACIIVTDNEKDFAGLRIINPMRG